MDKGILDTIMLLVMMYVLLVYTSPDIGVAIVPISILCIGLYIGYWLFQRLPETRPVDKA